MPENDIGDFIDQIPTASKFAFGVLVADAVIRRATAPQPNNPPTIVAVEAHTPSERELYLHMLKMATELTPENLAVVIAIVTDRLNNQK